MKLDFLTLSELQHYRMMVLIRIILAIFGGFLIASLTVACIGLMFPDQRALATYTGLLLSFVVWLSFIISIFTVKRTIFAIQLTFIIITVLSILTWCLQKWGQS